MKKADLSINVIIVAIIALVVLVVLIFTFTGKLSLFNSKISLCKEVQGNKCSAEFSDNICDDSQGYIVDPTRICLDSNKKVDPKQRCCTLLLKSTDQQPSS